MPPLAEYERALLSQEGVEKENELISRMQAEHLKK